MIANFFTFLLNSLGTFVSSQLWSTLFVITLSFVVILCLIKVVWVLVQSR